MTAQHSKQPKPMDQATPFGRPFEWFNRCCLKMHQLSSWRDGKIVRPFVLLLSSRSASLLPLPLCAHARMTPVHDRLHSFAGSNKAVLHPFPSLILNIWRSSSTLSVVFFSLYPLSTNATPTFLALLIRSAWVVYDRPREHSSSDAQ